MHIKIFGVILAWLVTGCAVNPYNNASNSEIAWQALHIVDVLQTVEIAQNPGYIESDPVTVQIIGEHPDTEDVLLWGATTSYIHAQFGKMLDRSKLPSSVKNSVRVIDSVLKLDVIKQNHKIGIRIGASW